MYKPVLSKIVDMILDPKLSREELVADIHESLRQLRKQLDDGNVDVDEFEILKVLYH